MFKVEESKATIQSKFAEEGRKITLPDGWDSAESVFFKARKALVYWRYIELPENIVEMLTQQ